MKSVNIEDFVIKIDLYLKNNINIGKCKRPKASVNRDRNCSNFHGTTVFPKKRHQQMGNMKR